MLGLRFAVIFSVFIIQRVASQCCNCDTELFISVDDLMKAIGPGIENFIDNNPNQCGCQQPRCQPPRQQPCGCQQQSCGCQQKSCGCQKPCGCQQQSCGCQQKSCGCQQPCGCQQQSFRSQQSCGCQQQPYGCQQQTFKSQQQSCGCQQQPCGCQQQSCGCQQQPCGCQQQPCGCQQQSCGCQQQPCGCQQSQKTVFAVGQPTFSISGINLGGSQCGCQPQPQCGCQSVQISQPNCGCQQPCGCQSIQIQPNCGCQPQCGCQSIQIQPSCGCQQQSLSFSNPSISFQPVSQPKSKPKPIKTEVPSCIIPAALLEAPPYGIVFAGDNLLIEGPVQVSGNMPFNSIIELGGVIPSSGSGCVQYTCGDSCSICY